MTSPPDPNRRSGAPPVRMVDVLLRYLKAEGARVVFGVPGGLLHPFFEAVEQDPGASPDRHEARGGRGVHGRRLRAGQPPARRVRGHLRPRRDEPAHRRLRRLRRRRADAGRSPARRRSHSFGKGAAQETLARVHGHRRDVPPSDQVLDDGHVARDSFRITCVARCASALTGRPGPVHLNVPVDFWERAAEEDVVRSADLPARPRSSSIGARSSERRRRSSARSARVPGGLGRRRAPARRSTCSTLAELLPARVATTPRGKGLFPEDHPLSLGVFGFAGHTATRATRSSADDVDVLLTVGASLNETTTLNWSPRSAAPAGRSSSSTSTPSGIGRNYPVDVPLVGDAQTVLDRAHLPHPPQHPRAARPALDVASSAGHRARHRALRGRRKRASDAQPLTPQRWRVRPRGGTAGERHRLLRHRRPHAVQHPPPLASEAGSSSSSTSGFGSMGHGTAAPIGAALAAPDRPVIAIIGDACFTMNGMELAHRSRVSGSGDLDRREQPDARHHLARQQAGGQQARDELGRLQAARSRSRRLRAPWAWPRGSSSGPGRSKPC